MGAELIEAWRRYYSGARPHSALGWKPPAQETIVMPAWTLRVVGKLDLVAAMT